MTPHQLYEFAINTGKLYEQHCTMARNAANPTVWVLHVKVNVLPTYKKEADEPYEGMSRVEVGRVATALASYYRIHVAEL